MEPEYHYESVAVALEELRKKGFSLDFNLDENCIVCGNSKFEAEEFDVVQVYRYEGDSDPADEATVYAIQSTSGLKGVLVTGYGMSYDGLSEKILKKLHYRES